MAAERDPVGRPKVQRPRHAPRLPAVYSAPFAGPTDWLQAAAGTHFQPEAPSRRRVYPGRLSEMEAAHRADPVRPDSSSDASVPAFSGAGRGRLPLVGVAVRVSEACCVADCLGRRPAAGRGRRLCSRKPDRMRTGPSRRQCRRVLRIVPRAVRSTGSCRRISRPHRQRTLRRVPRGEPGAVSACRSGSADPGWAVVAEVAARLQELAGDGEPPLAAQRLRGGAPLEHDWVRTPTQPVILCSTVDQLGSRLLFRGYGVSHRMKPVHAGLLGTDTLVLLDEAHLSEPFRQTLTDVRAIGNAAVRTVWLSATPSVSAQRRFPPPPADYDAVPRRMSPSATGLRSRTRNVCRRSWRTTVPRASPWWSGCWRCCQRTPRRIRRKRPRGPSVSRSRRRSLRADGRAACSAHRWSTSVRSWRIPRTRRAFLHMADLASRNQPRRDPGTARSPEARQPGRAGCVRNRGTPPSTPDLSGQVRERHEGRAARRLLMAGENRGDPEEVQVPDPEGLDGARGGDY